MKHLELRPAPLVSPVAALCVALLAAPAAAAEFDPLRALTTSDAAASRQGAASASAPASAPLPSALLEADALGRWLSGAEPGEALLPVGNLLAVGYGEARLEAPSGPALGLESGGVEVGRGEASWYGPGFHGRLTANGERFNQNAMTAAHKKLPFGTRVRVRVQRTGREVVVRINDRGPYVKGRIIDLSSAAATAVGLKARGHEAVVLYKLAGGEVLPPPAPPGNLDFGLGAGRGAPGGRTTLPQ